MLDVAPVVTVVGVKLTRIKESKDQNNPDGAFDPPRTGRPLTIFVAVTFVTLLVADAQSVTSLGPLLAMYP